MKKFILKSVISGYLESYHRVYFFFDLFSQPLSFVLWIQYICYTRPPLLRIFVHFLPVSSLFSVYKDRKHWRDDKKTKKSENWRRSFLMAISSTIPNLKYHCHPFIHSFIHISNHPLTQPFIHHVSFFHPFINSFIYPFIHPSIHALVNSSIN